jgi:hypothetical protein
VKDVRIDDVRNAKQRAGVGEDAAFSFSDLAGVAGVAHAMIQMRRRMTKSEEPVAPDREGGGGVGGAATFPSSC